MIWLILFCEDSRHEPSMTKPTKWHVHPARTQISLGIHPVWSVFAVRMKKALVLSYPLSAQRRLWSDWEDAQADLRLCWVHVSVCWFCHEAAHTSERPGDWFQEKIPGIQEEESEEKIFHTRNLRFCQRCHEWAGYGASWIFPSDNHIVWHLHK